jgi:hypothetical protein
MLQTHTSRAAALSPGELAFLQRLFDDVCRRRGIDKNSREAAVIAATMVDLYRLGVHDERQLLGMLPGTKSLY